MYVSIRTYRFGKGSIDELMHRVDRDLADAFVHETGFVAYHIVQTRRARGACRDARL